MKPYFYIHTNASKHITNRTDRSTARAHPCWSLVLWECMSGQSTCNWLGLSVLSIPKGGFPTVCCLVNPITTSIYSNNKRHKSHEILVKCQLTPFNRMNFPFLLVKYLSSYWCLVGNFREWSISSLVMSSSQQPPFPQQPIHSLRKTHQPWLPGKSQLPRWCRSASVLLKRSARNHRSCLGYRYTLW